MGGKYQYCSWVLIFNSSQSQPPGMNCPAVKPDFLKMNLYTIFICIHSQ